MMLRIVYNPELFWMNKKAAAGMVGFLFKLKTIALEGGGQAFLNDTQGGGQAQFDLQLHSVHVGGG